MGLHANLIVSGHVCRPPQCRFRSVPLLLALLCLLSGASVFGADRSPAAAPAIVHTFDARWLNHLDLRSPTNATLVWDTLHALSAIQGLANRPSPRFYLFYCSEYGVDTDQFWFDWLRQEDGWLAKSTIRSLTNLEQVVQAFRGSLKGLAVYDPAVPATAIAASTAAGCEDLVPVRFDPSPGSVYDRLANQMKLPVGLWLVEPSGKSRFTGQGTIPDSDEPSSGSAKIDVYRWALRRYLASGKVAPGFAAYYVDSFWQQHPTQGGPGMHTLSNHDYFIARQSFFFDLSPWADETPNDDPGQRLGLDKECLLQVLHALYVRADGGIVKIGGFPPWPFKYTAHSRPPGKHDGVPTEWEFGRLISQFNAYKEADAAGLGAMANASFFQHYPLAGGYPQPNGRPSVSHWKARGLIDASGKVAARFFVGHYVGDYDSPSWLYKAVPAFFKDPARGRVPLGWAFDPNLADRAPQTLVYAYRHATTNDFFIAGDSGAGYLNPRALTVRPDSGLPSGLEKWTDYCRRYYRRWDMSITGFLLDGAGGASTEHEFKAYQAFSPDGAGTHFEKGPAVHVGIGTCPERDLPDDAAAAAAFIDKAAKQRGEDEPGFLWARSILKSPGWYVEVSRLLAEKYPEAKVEVVDPYTFFGLIRAHLSRPE